MENKMTPERTRRSSFTASVARHGFTAIATKMSIDSVSVRVIRDADGRLVCDASLVADERVSLIERAEEALDDVLVDWSPNAFGISGYSEDSVESDR
jgi:hypothetical protein